MLRLTSGKTGVSSTTAVKGGGLAERLEGGVADVTGRSGIERTGEEETRQLETVERGQPRLKTRESEWHKPCPAGEGTSHGGRQATAEHESTQASCPRECSK